MARTQQRLTILTAVTRRFCPPSRLQHSQAMQQPVSSARPEISSAKTMMDIGTRRIFTEEHDIFRQSVRRFYQEEVVPYHSE